MASQHAIATFASGDNEPAVRSSLRRSVLIAAAFVIALAILSPGISAPFTKDAEPQSAQWMVDLVRHGNWLLPRDYYGFVERKPPLFYWLGAIGAKLRGGAIDEVRARTPSLVAGAALAALVMDWAAMDLGEAGGWLALAFLLGLYGFAARATLALTDMQMTLILMGAWRTLRPNLNGQVLLSRTILGGLVIGLGLLTKGPVVAVLIGLAAALYLLMNRENPLRLVTRAWPWIALVIAVAVAAAWYVPAFIVGRASDLGGVFVDENFGHFMPASMGGTGEAARPIYYIVARLVGGTMPLALLLPALAIAFAAGAFEMRVRSAMAYQLSMTLAVVLLFSVASAKRDDYILPAIPPLAILFAALFSDGIDENPRAALVGRVRNWAVGAIAVGSFAMIASVFATTKNGVLPNAMTAHLQSSDASFAAIFAVGLTRMAPPFASLVIGVAAGSTLMIVGLMRRRAIESGAGLALICLAAVTLWTGVLKPDEARSRSLGPFASAVKARVGDAQLYVAFDDPEFAWYYGDGVPALPRAVAQAGAPPGVEVYLVARPSELIRLAPAVRRPLIVEMRSNVMGGSPPTLYLIPTIATSAQSPPGLPDGARSVK
jgi:4-amino-4-deoxy-L-arabinose transferase-like glycosyltransferase